MSRDGGANQMTIDDDAVLFRKIQIGDGAAFEQLYGKYQSLVYTFALRGCGDRELAAEITQDVFVRLWTTTAEFRPEVSKFTTWLLTITRNICHDKLRGRGKNGESVEFGEEIQNQLPSPFDVPEKSAQAHWFREDIQGAMTQLNAEERTVVELAYFYGLTLTEISVRLNRPLGTIKTRLHKSLQVLRKNLKGWEGGVEG